MARSKSLNLVFIFLILIGCGKELPELENFDKQKWISNKNGCLKKRLSMAESIENQKDKLLALDEMKIVALLGKPDENELYKRNQKFYYYSITPAPQCDAEQDSVSRKLVIRFNAMGLAKEVEIQ